MAKKQTKAAFTSEQLNEARIPKSFWDKDRDDYFASESALAMVEKYMKKHRRAFRYGIPMLLRGPVLSGKSFLISYALRYFMLKGYKVRYWTLDEITDWMMRPDTGPKNFNVEFREAEFAALDNIGVPNEGSRSAFRKFLRVRIDENLPTLFGSSLTPTKDEEDDLFFQHFGEDAERLKVVGYQVHCHVNEFKVAARLNAVKLLQ